MTKYKLIKEYPGSPELGTIFKEEDTAPIFFCLIENQPEYWEKVNDNIWWVVFEQEHIQDDKVYFKSWTPYKIECIPNIGATHRYFFKTIEGAEEFILENCPSFKEAVSKLSKSIDRLNDSVKELSKERISLSKSIDNLKSKL